MNIQLSVDHKAYLHIIAALHTRTHYRRSNRHKDVWAFPSSELAIFDIWTLVDIWSRVDKDASTRAATDSVSASLQPWRWNRSSLVFKDFSALFSTISVRSPSLSLALFSSSLWNALIYGALVQTTHSVIKLQAPRQKNLLQLIIHIICHCVLKCSQAIKLVFSFALLFILLPPHVVWFTVFLKSTSFDGPSFSTQWLNGEKTSRQLSHAHRQILSKCPVILC